MRLQRNLPSEEPVYSENWMQELLDNINAERQEPDDPIDLLQWNHEVPASFTGIRFDSFSGLRFLAPLAPLQLNA